METNIKFEINSAFQDAFFDKSEYMLLWGGSGSGKSFAAAQKILLRTLNEEDNRTLVVMKIGGRLRQFAFQTILDVINIYKLNDLFDYKVSPLEIKCKQNGNLIIFAGLDDPEQLKSMPGIKNVWVEESTALQRRDFEQLNIRVRGLSKNYKQIILTFNGISKNNWIYEDFFENRKYHPAAIYNSTFKDNPFIGDDYEYRIRQSFKNNKNLLDVYLNGLWGNVNTNKIYSNWHVDESISQNFDSYKTRFAGIDFGFNDPNVLLCVGFNEDTIFIFKEFYRSGITIRQFAEEIKKIVPRNILCVADARSPGLIQELKNAGIHVRHSDKTPNSVNAGINFLKSMKILIHPDCKNTIEEIGEFSYLYQENSDTYLDKPTAGNDHCLDTLRYAADPVRMMKRITAGIKIF